MIDWIMSCNNCGHTIGGYQHDDPPSEHPVMNVMIECPRCDGFQPGLKIDLNQYSALQEVMLTGFINFLQGEIYRE